MRAKPQIALIGAGRLGAFHANNLARRVCVAELAAVCDVDAERAREVATALRVPWTGSTEEIFADASVDAVVIAAPTATHATLVEQAAAAGKHVFCEKPLALTVKECRRAIASVEAADVLLQIGFHRRFDPDFVLARAKVVAGELGKPYLLRISHRDMRAPEPGSYLAFDGNLFVDAMVHDFDTARWLVGEVAEVTTHATAVADARFAAEGDADHAVAVLRFESGALGVIDNSRSAGYGYECSVELIGSEATIRIGQERGSFRWLTPGCVSSGYAADHTQRHHLAYVSELEQFANALLCGEPSSVSGGDALAALEVSLAATRSHEEGRSIEIDRRAVRAAE
jgi:myo-inositol 2-dehydrogenase/D-chiro-inositol 1-dehydrogenase